MSSLSSQLHSLTIAQLWVLAEEKKLTNYKHLQNVHLVKLLMGECLDCGKQKKPCKGCGRRKQLYDQRRVVNGRPYTFAFGTAPTHRAF